MCIALVHALVYTTIKCYVSGKSHAYSLLVTTKVTTMSIATLLFVHIVIYIVIATHERSVVVRVTVRGTFVIYNYYVLHINWYYASCNWLYRDEINIQRVVFTDHLNDDYYNLVGISMMVIIPTHTVMVLTITTQFASSNQRNYQ